MADDFKKELGARVKEARLRAGYTQSALAEQAEVSVHHISSIERGIYDTRCELLKKMAVALGVTADYLLFGEEETAAESGELQRAILMASRLNEDTKLAEYILAGIKLIEKE